jgi:hypothetical protein
MDSKPQQARKTLLLIIHPLHMHYKLAFPCGNLKPAPF